MLDTGHSQPLAGDVLGEGRVEEEEQ